MEPGPAPVGRFLILAGNDQKLVEAFLGLFAGIIKGAVDPRDPETTLKIVSRPA